MELVAWTEIEATALRQSGQEALCHFCLLRLTRIISLDIFVHTCLVISLIFGIRLIFHVNNKQDRYKETERTNPSVLKRGQIDLLMTTIRACFSISLASFDSMRTMTTLKTIVPPFRQLSCSPSTSCKEQSP